MHRLKLFLSLSLSIALCALWAFGGFQVTLNGLDIWLSVYCCAMFGITNRYTIQAPKMLQIEFYGYIEYHHKQYSKHWNKCFTIIFTKRKTFFSKIESLKICSAYKFYMPLKCKHFTNLLHWISCRIPRACSFCFRNEKCTEFQVFDSGIPNLLRNGVCF